MTNQLFSIPVSVIVPAKNEENNLPACLQSIAPADEIFVVDSQSSDRTAEIAADYGAKVVQFYFKGGWPKKKNWSLENLPFRNEWVMIVDCDERIPLALWEEIAIAIQQPDYDGYYLNRKVIFLGQWLRYGGRYPDWNMRLFRHPKGRYENLHTADVNNTGDNEIHEHVLLKGKFGYLSNDMIHEDFRDIYQWLERHNRYSNWEARVYYNFLTGKYNEYTIKGETILPNLWGNAVERKRWLRQFWVRYVPFKPLLRFTTIYVFLFGFLDGRAGYIYARLMSHYEYQIGVKIYELKRFGGKLNISKTENDEKKSANLPQPDIN